MLDRIQVSCKKAVGITAAILKAGVADLNSFSISHRQRDKSRSVLAVEAMLEFQDNKPDHAVLHCESKLVNYAHGTKLEA